MFALLVVRSRCGYCGTLALCLQRAILLPQPAGFAIVCRVGASIGDAHNKHRQACEKQRACNDMRGAAASMLPDADVELWRSRAVVATERIKGLESIITVRARRRRGLRERAARVRATRASARRGEPASARMGTLAVADGRAAPATRLWPRRPARARVPCLAVARARRCSSARCPGGARASGVLLPGLTANSSLRAPLAAAQEMTRKLDEEERLREEAEEVAGEKLLEIDELKCVLRGRPLCACTSQPTLALLTRLARLLRSEIEAVEADAATREAALIAAASEREAMLMRNAAEREAALQATAAAATTAAEAASNALFCVSDSILRWREELVVASLEADNYGAVPSAQQVLDVVANMEHEVEISVVMADALPTELRNKLQAKKNEQVRRKRLEARVGDNWTYGVRSVMDAPERLARLVNAAGASTSAPAAAQRPTAQQNFSRIRTPPKSGKENASAFPPAMPAAAGAGGRPLEAMISNAMDLATKAMKPAKAAPKAASKSAIMDLPAFNVLMPGELPGGLAPEPVAPAPLKTYKSVPKAKRGTTGRVAGDRRSQVAAIASAFDDEPAVSQPMQRAVALR
jgi:hypothetical protein